MTLVPSYCAKFLKTSSGGAADSHRENPFIRAFGRLLVVVVAMRFVVVVAALALFGAAAFLLTTMGSELFPPVDSGQFTIYVRLPSGTRIERTEEKIQQVEQVVMDTLGQADPGFALGEEEAPDSHLQMVISNMYDVGGDYAGQGYTLQMQGEVRSMRDSFAQFANGLVIAILLVYLVMVAQFRSFIDPFIILLTVPLGFVGVVGLLWATGGTLLIMSFMGMIMMVGIVVEYSIVLVDFANHRVREGLSPRDAIIDATKIRLRPVLMTSLTTWLALLPMAAPQVLLEPFGLSGGDANVPLARAIIGGVLGATVLSLLVVPCLYTIMKRTTAMPNMS